MAMYGDGVAPWSWRLAALPARLPDADQWIGDRSLYVDYLRGMLAVDDSVGRLLALLDARGELENTLVVFTSDNGFHLGEHRLTNKMLMYERSIQVPLVLRAPGRAPAGAVRRPIVTNLDIAPTILAAAGVAVPEAVQGRSLWPLVRDAGTPWRDALFYEYHGSPDIPVIPSLVGVRTDRWKYIREATPDAPFEELYDLANDPEELVNLAPDPASADALEAMRARLAQERAAAGYPDSPPVVGAGESDWGWTFEYCKNEVVYQWRAFSRRLIDWLRPLKEWLFGGESRIAMRGVGGG
jgi:arylsulfatase A-like enzyme